MDAATSPAARRTWIPRWLRWTAAIFGLLILLVIGGIMGINAQAQSAYQREIQALNTAGIPTTMTELEARRPTVPDEVNSALLIDSVSDVLTKLNEDKETWSGVPFIGSVEVPLWGEPWPRERVEELKRFVVAHANLIATLDRVESMPIGRSRTDFVNANILTTFPNLAPVRMAAKIEALVALHDALESRLTDAARRCRMAMNFAGAVENEPTLLSALIVVSVNAICVDLLERILVKGELPVQELAAWQAAIGKKLESDYVFNAICGEMLLQQRNFQDILDGNFDLAALMNLTAGTAPQTAGPINPLFRPFVRLDRTKSLILMKPIVVSARDPIQLIRAAEQMEAQVQELSKLYLITNMLMPSLSRATILFAKHAAQLRCAVAALAAERFRIDHGQWPAALADLVPDYLSETPLDPFDAKPLRYRIDPDKVIIWSIDENGVDDGGLLTKPEEKRARAPDIGFRLLNPDLRGPIPIEDDSAAKQN